ncbi:Unknown protein [Striga hermonthica]|uniref:Uncharacterized protein n=1 Tax=Striga hermonthica TaxID=68872 RepID=A0A9N7NGT2_STRHE|nr:Unknown protein [Striga hermonthica]
MEDATVKFLLENLKQLLVTNADLISSAKIQVEWLNKDLRLFNTSIKDSTIEWQKGIHLWELVRQIRDFIPPATITLEVIGVSFLRCRHIVSSRPPSCSLQPRRRLTPMCHGLTGQRLLLMNSGTDKFSYRINWSRRNWPLSTFMRLTA